MPIEVGFTIRVSEIPFGYQAQLLDPDGRVLLTTEGVFQQDAVASLFANWVPAVGYHMKCAVMRKLPPLRKNQMAEGAHHRPSR